MPNTNTEIDWQAISAALRQPFNPADVDFRPQGKPSGNGKVQAVCYIDARTVADRLDDVVGPGAWEFTYEPLVTANGQVQIAKGRLSIHGVVKEDVGEASNFDPSKGCVSDALKRAAVLWGIGRYLYGIGGEWVTPDQYGRISNDDVKRLRAKLPTPNGNTALNRTPQPHPAAQPQHAPASTSDAPAASQTQAARSATKEQRDNLIKGAAAMGRELHLDDALTFDEAEAMLAAWRREWQQMNMHKRPATAAPVDTPDLSTLGNGGGRH